MEREQPETKRFGGVINCIQVAHMAIVSWRVAVLRMERQQGPILDGRGNNSPHVKRAPPVEEGPGWVKRNKQMLQVFENEAGALQALEGRNPV